MRTSMRWTLLLSVATVHRRGLVAPLAELVDRRVGRVTEWDVDQQHRRAEQQAADDRAAEADDHDEREDQCGDAGAIERAAPVRRLVEPLGAAPAGDLLRLLAGLRAAGTAGTLDRSGGSATVLATALLLRRGHQASER